MPIFHPASLQGADLAGVWYIFFFASIPVMVVVWGLIAYAVFRWRARPAMEGTLPPQFHSNPPVEITGVVIPVIMVIGLFYISYVREGVVDFLKPGPAAVVDVTGFRWSWEFRYPGTGIDVVGSPRRLPVLVLPKGRLVQINLTSTDVDHAFWVPAFLFKRDALPGMVNHFDVTPDKTGVFRGLCVEFCGLYHTLMDFRVVVVPPSTYARWIASRGTLPV